MDAVFDALGAWQVAELVIAFLYLVLQEFESYYHIKFNRWPKITKRARDSGKFYLHTGKALFVAALSINCPL